MNNFENKVLQTIKKHNMLNKGDSVLVGLSGGADSSVLLYALKKLEPVLEIKVFCAHLNHGIRGKEAQRDMIFSQEFAKTLNVQIKCKTVDVPGYSKTHKISDETAGRKLRYEFFNKVSEDFGCNKIAVAHNKNDRAETIVMNMIRGCGSNGFYGIKPVNNNIIRPLIDVLRSEIEEYAREKKIDYVTDSSNAMDIYTRNLVRNKILKEMSGLNPKAVDNIIRTSDIIYEENKLATESILSVCPVVISEDCAKVNKNLFMDLNNSQKRQLILYCVSQICKSTENVSFSQLDNVLSSVATGKTFKIGSHANIVNTSDEIIITAVEQKDIQYEYNVNDNGLCYIPELNKTYKFEYVEAYKKEKDATYISADGYEIHDLKLRTKLNGDSFIPSGLKGTKKVKKFFIDSKIPSFERHCYPLLVLNDEILAILPLRVNEKYKIDTTTDKILRIKEYGGTYEEK